MNLRQFHSMLFGISLALVSSASLAKTVCPTTMMAALGQKNARKIQNIIEKATADFHPDLAAVPPEVAHTASENLPNFKRLDLLNPVKQPAKIFADVYFGDYSSSSPDVFVLPKDPLLFCTLTPSQMVFLSDGVTHHYATIYGVDYERNIVTLIDRWAPVSFLLQDHNVAGVTARPYKGAKDQPFLDISFDDFAKVLSGTLEAFATELYFKTLEKLYPHLRSDSDYFFWKLSRQLEAGSFDVDFVAILEAMEQSKGITSPKFRLLQSYANDKLIGVMTGFSISAPGRANVAEAIPKVREDFIHRLGDYATTLPWMLKWLLLTRAEQSEDIELRLKIVDAYLKSTPLDVDFQISRAGILFELKRPADALTQLDAARKQWESDVAEAIAVSPREKALQFFFAKNYGLESFDILRWRYARIELMRVEAEIRAKKDTAAGNRLSDLIDKYKSNLPVEFFGDFIEIEWLKNNVEDEASFLKTVLPFAKDENIRNHFAEALFKQFMINQPITTLPQPALAELKRSTTGKALCDIVGVGRTIPKTSTSDEESLQKYCGSVR